MMHFMSSWGSLCFSRSWPVSPNQPHLGAVHGAASLPVRAGASAVPSQFTPDIPTFCLLFPLTRGSLLEDGNFVLLCKEPALRLIDFIAVLFPFRWFLLSRALISFLPRLWVYFAPLFLGAGDGNVDDWFETSPLFPNTCIHCCRIPSQSCFSCVHKFRLHFHWVQFLF